LETARTPLLRAACGSVILFELSGDTRGRAGGPPRVTLSREGDTQRKKMWLNLQRTVEKLGCIGKNGVG